MKEKILGNKKNILLGTLIVGVLAMTVAFAALATNLTINGTANVAATKWNIRFEDWEKVAITEVDGHSNTAVSPAANALTKQDGSNVTKVSGVNVVLNQPGDTARYIFKIANRGTIDAKLSNFTVTDTTSNTLVDYEVKCYDNETQDHVPTGTEITTNSVLSANGGLAYCYMQVKYKEQSQPSQTPGSNQVYNQASEVSTNIEATWTWVQADGASSPATPSTPEPSSNILYYYSPDQTSGGATLSNEKNHWVRINPQTYERLVCGVFPNGTVCFNEDSYDRTDNERIIVNGTKTLALKQQFEAAGATCLIDEWDFRCGILANPSDPEDTRMSFYCYMDNDASDVECSNDGSDTCGFSGEYPYDSENDGPGIYCYD